MIINLLTIGLGGFLGAISRYLVFMVDDHFYHKTDFPLGTLFVNLLGSLLIGIALGLSVKYDILSRGSFSHYLFITGFLGAFTTFSTFSQDSFILLTEKHYYFFVSNIILNVIIGILLVTLGYFLVIKDF
ncbi:MAG: fluoride efflux transporter CrcB [Candidatus Peregrinibacteria bacterium]|nr:fluoride efflux transporter CrcB [Candidatus Peregrinibacteria bacterium]